MTDFAVWRDRVDAFIADRTKKENTRQTYLQRLLRYLDWCETTGVDPAHATQQDVVAYVEDMTAAHLSASTIYGFVFTARGFYRWLMIERYADANPALGVDPGYVPHTIRDTLTVEQLRAVWNAAIQPRDRVLVALMGLCALGTDEAGLARVEDLSTVEGVPVLRLPSRSKLHEIGFVVLPPEVHEAVLTDGSGRA